MVAYKEILASNALIKDATDSRLVAVFVGGTSGIGKYTLQALVATGASLRIHLVGRPSAAERMQAFIQELHALNTNADILWTEGEVSLLAETKRVCEVISDREKSRGGGAIDLLFLTAGYAPFSPRREETAEGIEFAQSLEYYSRMLFVLHLRPLLERATAPRVVSVLGGGMLERATVDVDDLDLKKPEGSLRFFHTQPLYATMNTAMLEKLSIDLPNVTFMHSWPGWVNTGNVWRGVVNPNSIIGWLIWLFLEPLIGLMSYSDEESAQRHLFQCTSAAFGGRGVPWQGVPGVNTFLRPANGLFLVNYKCDCTPNAKAMPLVRERVQKKVWDHTHEVLGPYK